MFILDKHKLSQLWTHKFEDNLILLPEASLNYRTNKSHYKNKIGLASCTKRNAISEYSCVFLSFFGCIVNRLWRMKEKLSYRLSFCIFTLWFTKWRRITMNCQMSTEMRSDFVIKSVVESTLIWFDNANEFVFLKLVKRTSFFKVGF